MTRSMSSESVRLLCALGAGLLAVYPVQARAQPETGPDPVAEALFHNGRDLVEHGHWRAGCAKFRASLARYRAPSTLLNLARCDEHDGKIASAWARYQRALVLNRDTPGEERRHDLGAIARAGIAKLTPELPRLRVVVASAPPGLRIDEGGRALPVGDAVPLDPGPHRVTASAPGFVAETRSVVLEPSRTSVLEFSLTPVPHVKSARPEGASPAVHAPEARAEASHHGVPAWVWITGGVGLALGGASLGFALDAKSTADELEKICGPDLICNENPSFDPGPMNARKDRDIGLAIGLGSAGVIALGVSIVGIVQASTAPSSASSRPRWLSAGAWFGPSSGGGSVRWRF